MSVIEVCLNPLNRLHLNNPLKQTSAIWFSTTPQRVLTHHTKSYVTTLLMYFHGAWLTSTIHNHIRRRTFSPTPRSSAHVMICLLIFVDGGKVLFCCNLSYVTSWSNFSREKQNKKKHNTMLLTILFWNECNLLSCATFCTVGRFKV